MIQDFYKTPFTLYKRVDTKINGIVTTTYTVDATSYTGAVFQPSAQVMIRLGKIDHYIQKTLYCSCLVPIEAGDRILIDFKNYTVIGAPLNTNSIGHHQVVSLESVA